MWGTLGTVVRSIRPYQSSEQYLYAMKEDLAEWLKELYDLDIEVGTFLEVLETGTVLCSHANNITHVAREFARACPGVACHLHLPAAGVACNVTAQPGTFQARDNVSNFIQWCRKEMDIKGRVLGSSCHHVPVCDPLRLLLASPLVFSLVSPKASATPASGSTVLMCPSAGISCTSSPCSFPGAGTQRACLLWCKYVLEGVEMERADAAARPCHARHDLSHQDIRSGPGSEQRVCHLVPTTSDAQEGHGHGGTHGQHTQPRGFVALGCRETAVTPLLEDAQGEGSSSVNLSQPWLDPAIFLAGWLWGITSLWVGFDSTCAPHPVCPCLQVPALAQSTLALPQTS